jgi:hypothetical protein
MLGRKKNFRNCPMRYGNKRRTADLKSQKKPSTMKKEITASARIEEDLYDKRGTASKHD